MVEGRQHSALSRLGYMFLALSEAASWFDAKVIDRTVNGVCSITRAVATLSKWCDKWIIDGLGVNAPATIARLISYPMRSSEWGLSRNGVLPVGSYAMVLADHSSPGDRNDRVYAPDASCTGESKQ